LEVIIRLLKTKAAGPRQPQVIVYDVDAELADDDILRGLLAKNKEFGLTDEEVDTMHVMHKLGPRTGSTTNWVIEVPAKILHKIDNKSVFKLHQKIL